MPSTEQDFFHRLRTALGKTDTSLAPLAPSRASGELDSLLTRTQRSRAQLLELLEQLQEAATPLNLKLHTPQTIQESATLVADIARNAETEWGGSKQIIMHNTPLLHQMQLDKELTGDNIPVVLAVPEDGVDEATNAARIRTRTEASYIGITSGKWCAVDCAALAVFTTPDTPRATSLVPSIHIAIITLEQLVADLPELYAKLEQHNQSTPLPASFTFISGPSKTADIEAQLVHGAHGPREMHLVVITG